MHGQPGMSENLGTTAPQLMGQEARAATGDGLMLGHSQIAHYLLSLGLLKPRAVVEDGLTVVDASRRNCVFIATTRSGPTYVVKQAGPRSATHAQA